MVIVFLALAMLIYFAQHFQCAFSAGRSVKLDERVAALLLFKTAALEIIELELYPALYKLNGLLEVCF